MKNNFLAFMILLLPQLGWTKAKIVFADNCTKEEVRVATPNGVHLRAELSDLSNDEGVTLRITLNPALPQEMIKEQDQKRWTIEYGTQSRRMFRRNLIHVDQDGLVIAPISLPEKKWMQQVEERHGGFRVWNAEMKWFQKKSKKSGALATTFYNSSSRGPYFQVLSKALCQWEGEIEVASKLYENRHDSLKIITRDTSATWEQGSTVGMSLGFNNMEGNPHPLAHIQSLSSGFLGWLFDEWHTQLGSQRTYSLTRSYQLNMNEAGVFVKKQSFNRHKARRFEWDQNANQCGDFVPVSEGYIDVGILSESFAVIPPEYAGHAEKIKVFLESNHMRMSNCMDTIGFGSTYADDIISSGSGGLLFYYRI